MAKKKTLDPMADVDQAAAALSAMIDGETQEDEEDETDSFKTQEEDGLRTTILIPQSRYLDLKTLFLIQHPDSLNVLINTALQSYIDANQQAIDEYQGRYGLPPLPKKRGRRK